LEKNSLRLLSAAAWTKYLSNINLECTFGPEELFEKHVVEETG
jgi:hypothetical protein